jgi:hypothetical protein
MKQLQRLWRPMRTFTVAAAALACIVAAPGSAQATSLSQGGTLTETFFLAGNGTDPAVDLTATLSLTLVSLNSTTAVLQVTLTNTTQEITNGQPSILSVGFATDPNATAISGATTGFVGDGTTDADVFEGYGISSIPSLSLVELCAYAAQNCAGGNVNQGLLTGQTDIFQITLTGTWGSSINFTDFGIKFQGAPSSFEFYGDGDGSTNNDGDGSQSGPEPASLLLFGTALSAAAARMRRKSSARS